MAFLRRPLRITYRQGSRALLLRAALTDNPHLKQGNLFRPSSLSDDTRAFWWSTGWHHAKHKEPKQ